MVGNARTSFVKHGPPWHWSINLNTFNSKKYFSYFKESPAKIPPVVRKNALLNSSTKKIRYKCYINLCKSDFLFQHNYLYFLPMFIYKVCERNVSIFPSAYMKW